MKTNDLERDLGLSKHTIRYYEKEGFIQLKEMKMVIVITILMMYKS